MQGIFEAGDQATGLKWVRPGFGFTEEDDRLWALGWPHLFYLTPGDIAPKTRTDRKAFHRTYDPIGPEMPAGMASKLVRYYTAGVDEAKLSAALQNDDPISEDEALAAAHYATSASFGHFLLYALEAIRSSAWVLEHVVNALENTPNEQWKLSPHEAFSSNVTLRLPIVMLRARASDVERATARLRALAARLEAAGLGEFHRGLQMLKRALDPVPPPPWSHFLLTPDHAALVREHVVPTIATTKPADRFWPDARLAFLGGDPVIEAYVKHGAQLHKDHKKALVVGMTRCAHPSVPELMRSIGGTVGKKWLKAHGHPV